MAGTRRRKMKLFDIEGDEETQMNFSQPEHTRMPSTLVPSPPREEAHQGNPKVDEEASSDDECAI